jgi:hypothetical protein
VSPHKGLFVCALLTLFASVSLESQRKQELPSLEIDGTLIQLGMTQVQVMTALDKNGMKLRFLWDGHAALVVRKDAPNLNDADSQSTFYDGRAAYVSFQFPQAHSAVQLAQEIAGAVELVESKDCSLRNFSAHGTGGGHSDVIASCGSKTIVIMTSEPLNGERSTHVEISIGSSALPEGTK